MINPSLLRLEKDTFGCVHVSCQTSCLSSHSMINHHMLLLESDFFKEGETQKLFHQYLTRSRWFLTLFFFYLHQNLQLGIVLATINKHRQAVHLSQRPIGTSTSTILICCSNMSFHLHVLLQLQYFFYLSRVDKWWTLSHSSCHGLFLVTDLPQPLLRATRTWLAYANALTPNTCSTYTTNI